MNKSQAFDVMQMRAKIQVDEIMKQHDIVMNGQEPELIDDNKTGDIKELFDNLEE